MNDIIEEIEKSNNIILLCHINPDGDAIGSTISLYHALKYLNKDVDMIIKEAPSRFSFIEGFSDIKTSPLRDYDLAIVVDTATKERVGYRKILDKSRKIINIDHHLSNSKYGSINYIANTQSCSEIIYTLLTAMHIPLSPKIATPIYTGLLTDSGGFANPLVTSKTFRIASKISEVIDVSDIYKRVLSTTTKSQIALEKIYLQNLSYLEDDQICFSYVTYEDIKNAHAKENECDILVNIAKEIENVQISIFVRVYEESSRVSIRTNNTVDANKIAASLGGGGHQNASGVITNLPFPILKERLLEEARNELNEWNNSHKQAKKLHK